MKYTSDDFFEAIHIARRRAGMTVAALEKAVGIGHGNLQWSYRRYQSGLENYGGGWPNMRTVSRVLEATNTAPEQWARDVEQVRILRERPEIGEYLRRDW